MRAPSAPTRAAPAVLAAATLLAAGLLHAGPALAHAHLASAEPPPGGSLTAPPTRLELTFTEGVNPAFSGLRVAGPGGAVPLGAPAQGPGGSATLVVPLGAPLVPGSYRVEWHALATDGHRSEGAYGFTLRP